ncbi:50S ribosomal protein L19 [Candidatus Saccharibacteria bacterium]|jgi:large subunit ribosomal protein L19|nr:50S ribosomal protein L19 [Candidatus Saccharibacteria bacterium]
MQSLVNKIEDKYKKGQVVDVKTGDTVRVHQKIKEGNKERVQIFEGMVIRTSRNNSLTSSITVRRIASGVGVEKSFIVHGPNVLKIEVTKRSKVRRNYLTYIRTRTGKATRLTGVDFDKHAVNEIRDLEAEKAEEELARQKEAEHQKAEAERLAKEAEEEAKIKATLGDRIKE